MDCTDKTETTEKEYGTNKKAEVAPRGCSPRRTSRSAHEYLRLKFGRNFKQPIAGMFFDMESRYGAKTTPTTRRVSRDSDTRSLY